MSVCGSISELIEVLGYSVRGDRRIGKTGLDGFLGPEQSRRDSAIDIDGSLGERVERAMVEALANLLEVTTVR
ncbi:MAG TPA: hypothetical protein VIR58_00515 [Acidimicrobiales bacterium]